MPFPAAQALQFIASAGTELLLELHKKARQRVQPGALLVITKSRHPAHVGLFGHALLATRATTCPMVARQVELNHAATPPCPGHACQNRCTHGSAPLSCCFRAPQCTRTEPLRLWLLLLPGLLRPSPSALGAGCAAAGDTCASWRRSMRCWLILQSSASLLRTSYLHHESVAVRPWRPERLQQEQEKRRACHSQVSFCWPMS